MLKIAVDVREACRERRTGKGQWTYGFVSEMLKRSAIEIILISDSPLPEIWQTNRVKVIMFPAGLLWHWKVTKEIKRIQHVDFYISPTSYIVPALIGKKVKVIPIVHDLIAFRNEPHDKKAVMIERSLLKRTLKQAAHIFTVSENTKEDILTKYSFLKSEKITPIFAGPMHEDKGSNTPDNKTILCAGTLSPRKNQLRLIEAYNKLPEELKKQYKLVLVGSRGWNDQKIIDAIRSSVGVIWKGHVTDDEYEVLMRSCTVLALPSLYEGFGLQILDALKRGVPILTSKRGSIPELVGNNAVFVDPKDIADISNGLEELLTNEDLREDLSKRGPDYARRYSWQHSVDLFMEAVHNI
ncbi:glycosyltransferase family 4 protein [Patescibacteria group bacterium]|nr:glycosyltransferase family 4 protein [Patescibacteria group bacterium]